MLGIRGQRTKSKPKVIIMCVIIFQVTQPTYPQCTNVTVGRTDGQTDNLRWQYRALHANRAAVKIIQMYDPSCEKNTF